LFLGSRSRLFNKKNSKQTFALGPKIWFLESAKFIIFFQKKMGCFRFKLSSSENDKKEAPVLFLRQEKN
jgi:hypothetical protein